MTAEDLHWLFSTIAQTLGAIVGVIGMVSVYKLQTLFNNMNAIIEQNREFLYSTIPEEVVIITAEEFITVWDDYKKKQQQQKTTPTHHWKVLEASAKGLTKLLDSRKQLRFRFLLFLILNLSFIFLSLLALPYCQDLTLLGVKIIIITVLFLVISLGLTLYLCDFLIETTATKREEIEET